MSRSETTPPSSIWEGRQRVENTMNRFLDEVDKSAKDSFPCIFKADPPSLLYHYTSFESSQKILEGNSIKFKHVKFMNDREEMQYGLTMFYELVSLIIKNENDEGHWF
jgi:hypothetical protein